MRKVEFAVRSTHTIQVPQFGTQDLQPHGDGGALFTCAMVSTCAPLFDNCQDNYAVEDELIEAGVLDNSCTPDSESCQFFCNFEDQRGADLFIARLNDYLKFIATHTDRAGVAEAFKNRPRPSDSVSNDAALADVAQG